VRRVVVVVCDGLGVGAAPDAAAYGDAGSDTLGHALDRYPVPLPNLESLGLLSLLEPARGRAAGARGKAFELSAGKDTTTGHWEMMGLVVERPFPLYPDGFPDEVVDPLEKFIGKKVLGNKAASGTEIIRELGPEHLATGRPITIDDEPDVARLTDHHELDLETAVREAIQLAEPIAPLDRPDCPGLCVVCGLALDEGVHDHPDEDIDPRLEALRGFRPDDG